MDQEFRDDRRRGRIVIVLGIILAVSAGAGAFYLINQAQQQAGQGELQRVPAVVAIAVIPAREVIEAADIEVRMVPLDPTNASGVIADPADAIGRIPAVSILQGQIITTNMLASSVEGGQFSILGPDETVGPDSEAFRAVSLTVSDDLAVGGLLEAGQSVDVFVTVVIAVPGDLVEEGRYYADRATKITYQDMVILARAGAFYVVRAPLAIAEEISHLQATGNATFSLALRPDEDTRLADVTVLGQTTNRIIEQYGLPIPEVFPPGSGPLQTPVPTPSPEPSPEPEPSASAQPSASPGAP
jgi:Flp pilus assembly protein CpaB